MRIYFFGILIGSLGWFLAAGANPSASGVDKARSRIEELFKWKVSDTLHLDVEEEAKFSEILKTIGEKRRLLSGKMSDTVIAVTQAKKEEDRKRLFDEYKTALKSYSELQLQEIEQVEKLWGVEKTAQYIALKSDLNLKFKDFLSGKSGKESDGKEGKEKKEKKPKLAEPKVIEGN